MQDQLPRESGFSKFTRILGMVMSFVYVVFGVALYMKVINFPMEDTYNKILGIGLIIYGAFRFYRAMKKQNFN